MASMGDRIRSARTARGLSQTELARRAGISRQAFGAIESGAYQPGVGVALALARELGESVEALFGDSTDDSVEAAIPGGAPVAAGTHVALARIGGRVVAVPWPASQRSLAPAGGVVERAMGRRATVASFLSPTEIDSTLLIAGCDPAVAILADWIRRHHASIAVAPLVRGSGSALAALADGSVHVAGLHLRDPRSGDYNLVQARRAMGHRPMTVVNFARWELGLATAPGNPLGIRGFDDLARPGITIVNREHGAGAREALDEALGASGIPTSSIRGYDREAGGHLEVAEAIAAGHADAGVTIRVAADAYGLGFVPIREERYDVAIPEREMEREPVRAMLDAMGSSRFAREVAALCGYDTSAMGTVVADA